MTTEDKTIHLSIQSMSCASCVKRIENGLEKQEGIVKASVNLATHSALVIFKKDLLSPGDIIHLISDIGYPASLQEDLFQKKSSPFPIRPYVALFLAALLAFPMLLTPFNIHIMLPPWWQMMIATIMQFFFGAEFYRRAYSGLRATTGNMDQLVVLGTSTAYLYSLFLLLTNKHHELYFESSAMIIALVLFGKYLESKATNQTTLAIQELQDLHPEYATLTNQQKILVNDLAIGFEILIKGGERIPVDALIIDGSSFVNESMVTGESLPVEKAIGSSIIGGTLNGQGTLKARVTHTASEGTLARIIRLIESAQLEKAPIQKLVDKISSYFVPAIIIFAFLSFFFALFRSLPLEESILRAVAVLVIACPCALGLATPTALMVATGMAAKKGILIKETKSFETSQNLHTLIFDKTGTLTIGKPSVQFLYAEQEEKFLHIIGALQKGSDHPLSSATLEELKKRKIPHSDMAKDIELIPGFGLSGYVDQKKYSLNGPRLLQKHDDQFYSKLATEREEKGETISLLFSHDDNKIIGLITFADTLRPSAQQSVHDLQRQGIRVGILSGDNEGSVKNIANILGVDFYHSLQLPEDKAMFIKSEKAKHKKMIAFVGDGMNDAPALVAADLSFAMASGTHIAMNSASITLMNENLLLVPEALSLAKKTYRKIQQNLFWAFIYNMIALPFAALGALNPTLAGLAMSLSSVSVVLNSLSLKIYFRRSS
jgi:P-type Cu+ transporter